MSGVTVPDDTAGNDATCPSCGKSFPTPPRYSAEVSTDTPSSPPGYALSSEVPSPTPAAPPGYVPPVGGGGFLPPSSSSTSPTSGHTRALSIVISPKVFEWLPAVFLTLTFFLTFFSWVGTHVGGAAVYSQGPWRAVGGWVKRNLELEEFAPPKTTGWQDRDKDKVKVEGDWLLMVPFLLLLLLATAVAIAERVFHRLGSQKPPALDNLWPKRHVVIAALSVATLALLVLQSLTGFGLERAVRKVAEMNIDSAGQRAQAQGNDWKLAKVKYEEEKELARFNLSRTIWMHLAVACTVIATLAAIGNILFERRGDKPPPKLSLRY